MGVIVIVTGGRRHVVSVEALAFLERTLRTLGAKEIHTAGSDGVAAQVEAGGATARYRRAARHSEVDARRSSECG